MKLILGSDLSFLLKYGYEATGIPKDEMRIGYVTTASKGSSDRSFLIRTKDTIRENGYLLEEVDIELLSPDELRNFFNDKNVIHIEWGNTFYLLKAIRETGFIDILREQIQSGKIYIGTSAWAYVMCPTIEVANWNDTGRDRFGITDFTALGYVPFVLKAHYTEALKDKIQEKIPTLQYPIRILKDGQGIVVENGQPRFYGDEEEVVL